MNTGSPIGRRAFPWPALALSLIMPACYASSPGPYGDDYRYRHPYYPPQGQSYGYSREDFARLAHELDDRAARAHEIAERRAAGYGPGEREFFERIHHFSDQARAFHERYETGQINSRPRMREEVQHLLDDARATDDAIRRANVFPEVWNEWQGVLRVLQRMLDAAR